MSVSKKFNLSKEERAHFNALNYTIKYLEDSVSQFFGAIITERLGFKPEPDQAVEWKLNEDNTELEVVVHEPDTGTTSR